MLCLPGFVPVWKVDHATGEMGGNVLPSGTKAALFLECGEMRELVLGEQLLR